MPAKYLPLIADYERRIDAAFSAGDISEARHLLDRLRELPNMPDFPLSVEPRFREVMERFDAMTRQSFKQAPISGQAQNSSDQLDRG